MRGGHPIEAHPSAKRMRPNASRFSQAGVGNPERARAMTLSLARARGLGPAPARKRTASTLACIPLVHVLLQACAPADTSRTLHVYAASSLAESFAAMEHAFEAAHPDTDVVLAFAGSQVLRLQIEQGAPADVFASADPAHMQALVERGRVRDGHIFAHNQLVIIVPPGNPARIESFRDLPRASRLVIGTESVPVGSYARLALRRAEAAGDGGFAASVLKRVASEESNVRLVRAKVELGEADAAIVYRSDTVAAARVHAIEIPPDLNVSADYSIGIVEGSANGDLAEAWLAFVLSGEGRRLLARHGFAAE